MAKHPLTCPTVLRQLLRYDAETGKLYWKPRARIWFKSDAAWRTWTSTYSDREAFQSKGGPGYHQSMIFGTVYLAHRVIWAMQTGRWPDVHVDHINGVRHDNRWSNLRSVTRAENQKNMQLRRDNTSGHAGIGWSNRTRKWRTRIFADGKEHHIGDFHDINDAIAARKAAEAEHGFHKNHGRAA